MDKKIGEITHYFDKISVAVVKLTSSLKVGDSIRIETKDGDVNQTVSSMQVKHEEIQSAKKGDEVGLKTEKPVKEGNVVYLVK